MSVHLSKAPQQLKEEFIKLKTRKNIADLLELTVKQLNFHLYVLPLEKRYAVLKIAKKSGGVREISAPISPIKIIQRKLRQVLEAVYQPKPSTHGFVIDRSIITNAQIHKKQ
jgi:RNA-directed DNA polymerase